MDHRIDDIKKRHKERKSMMLKHMNHSSDLPIYTKSKNYESKNPSGIHPLFNAQKFLLRLFIAAAIILLVGIIYKQPNNAYPQVKSVVQQTLKKEFNFAEVSAWYEKNFGKPLALFPSISKENKGKSKAVGNVNPNYAVPVIGGKITQSFGKNGQGVYIQTGAGSSVEAVQDGYVTSIETKDKIGKTVIIQHTNGTESWYGKLDAVNVKLYDFVKKGQKIGTVSKGDSNTAGAFYFAIKKGNSFIDPIQVIKFD